MPPPSVDIKDLLVTNSVGTFGAASGWGIFIGLEPEDPDTTLTIYDTPGEDANPKYSLDFPRWQVRVRGTPHGYDSAFDKAIEVKELLLGLPPQDINGTFYDGVFIVGDIFFLQSDRKGRPVIISNWRGIIEPAVSGNRIAL